MKRLTPDQKAGIYITVSVHLAVIIVLLLIRIGQEIQRENSFVLDFTQQEEMERKQEEARLHEMTAAQLEELIAAAQSVPVRNVTVDRSSLKDDRGTNAEELYKEAERLAQYGKLIGICFQLRDDVFDYGTAEVGKPLGNDMKEGKLTLPAIYAVVHSDDASMRELALKVRRREASAEEMHQLMDFTVSQGGLEYAQWHMKDMQGMADGLIDDNCDAVITEALHLLASFVAERVL